MRSSGLAVLGVWFLAILAGCTEAPTPAAAAAFTSSTLTVGSGKGAVQGIVTDDEQRPIKDVEVIVASSVETLANASTVRTDEQGAFLIEGLDAGRYVLYVRRLGYQEAAPKAIEVAEGETAEVRIELKPLAKLVPHVLTVPYSLVFLNAACVVAEDTASQCSVNGYSGGNHVHPFDIQELEVGELRSLVVETKWAENVGAFPAYFRTDVFSPEQTKIDPTFPGLSRTYWADTNPYHWDSVPDSAKSPTHLLLQRSGDPLAMHSPERTELNQGKPIETSGVWHVTVDYYPEGVGTGVYVVAQQSVAAAASFFFVDPVPKPDWSAWST